MESNVLKFPKKPVRKLAANDAVSPVVENDNSASSPSTPKLVKFVKVLGRAFRFALFMIMYWLRVIVVNVCSIVSVVMLFAWLFAMYAFPEKTTMVRAFGSVSLSCFVVAWAYDYVLMKLSPVPMVDSL